jgi:hypothetical protein
LGGVKFAGKMGSLEQGGSFRKGFLRTFVGSKKSNFYHD